MLDDNNFRNQIIFKNFQFKKMEYGSKFKKYANKLEIKEVWKIKGSSVIYQKMRINPKAFTIPILTTLGYADLTEVKIQGQQMLQDFFSFSNNT